MAQIEFNRLIHDICETEVLVVGGGPAGIAAAISSARNGSKTMLVEKCGFVGGMSTAATVGPFMTSYDGSGQKQIIRGIFDELVTRMEQRGGAIHPSKIGVATPYAAFIRTGHSHVTPFDSEMMKLVSEEMLQEAGVELLYYTQFLDCIIENGHIQSVVIAKKSGLAAVQPKIVIDCSGDADVAEKAAVPIIKGQEKGGEMQPATMFFRVYGVDTEKVYRYVDECKDLMGRPFYGVFSWLIEEGMKNGEWKIARTEMGTYECPTKGEWKLNTTRIQGIDGTKSEDLTKASIEGRQQVQQVYKFLIKHVPGFENAKLMESGSVVGVRETRHIQGEYVIQKEDVLQSKTFDDDILLCSNAIDIHDDKTGGGEYVVVDSWYGIPYRSLVPKGCSNLLVAGKTISATSAAVSAFRVMPCCFGIGQAAGTAAALCIKHALAPTAISVDELQNTLISQDVFLNK